MVTYKDTISEATAELGTSVREVNQAVAEGMLHAGERNIKFAQGTFEHEVELLRSHAKSTRAVTDKLVEGSEKGEPFFEFVVDTAVAAQEHNVKFIQGLVEDSSELLESHVEATRALVQTLTEQSRKQRETWEGLLRGTWDAYRGFFPSPLSYYERVMETAESVARRGVETAEKMMPHEKPAVHAAKK